MWLRYGAGCPVPVSLVVSDGHDRADRPWPLELLMLTAAGFQILALALLALQALVDVSPISHSLASTEQAGGCSGRARWS